LQVQDQDKTVSKCQVTKAWSQKLYHCHNMWKKYKSN